MARRIKVTEASPLRPRLTPVSREAHEAAIRESAAYYTTARFLGRGQFAKARHSTLAEARAAGSGDGRTMVYAVDAAGRSAWVENV